MSMIDTQNAKQIRDPMDVLITMELPDEGVNLTYSGYSTTAKVADGELGETSWPMRQIADLQGEGFPLDGSHVLYNPSTPASAANGKIGVRSNIGETVTVTVTANRSIASLTIFATGASSVEYNGQTAAIVGGSVVIPVGATSVTLTFNPVSETERIEVSDITAGTTFRITNESLIKAVVSLRSDLSPFGQTLPESEINIDVYQDVDISEVVATIPEDTPITYQAGYPGDMSPVRKFYVSGQVTWADNVLHIQGVDAVHFLENVIINSPVTSQTSSDWAGVPRWLLDRAGIEYTMSRYLYGWTRSVGLRRWLIRPGTNAREYFSICQNTFNLTDRDGNFHDGTGTLAGPLQFAYIDAGIPTLRTWTPYGRGTIAESDCANIQRNRNVPVTRVDYTHEQVLTSNFDMTWYDVKYSPQKVGSASFVKGVGTSLDFDQLTYCWMIGIDLGARGDNDYGKKFNDKYNPPIGFYILSSGVEGVVPVSTDGTDSVYGTSYLPTLPFTSGAKLLPFGRTPQEEYTGGSSATSRLFSSFVPWSQGYDGWFLGYQQLARIWTADQMWDALVACEIISDRSALAFELDIYGAPVVTNPVTGTVHVPGDGKTEAARDLAMMGEVYARTESDGEVRVYPEKALAAPMYRSNKTISFTWKGDPRIQPRDVFTFRELDGTADLWTFENITLTHEKGGTLAEITARKGVI